MKRGPLLYAAGVLAVAGLVLWVGGMLVGPGGRAGLWVGVAVAVLAQLCLAVPLLRLGPDRRLVAYGVGAVGRMVVLALSALLLVPALELAPAPTLLSLVAVFFGTILLEPALLAGGTATHTEASR